LAHLYVPVGGAYPHGLTPGSATASAGSPNYRRRSANYGRLPARG